MIKITETIIDKNVNWDKVKHPVLIQHRYNKAVMLTLADSTWKYPNTNIIDVVCIIGYKDWAIGTTINGINLLNFNLVENSITIENE